MSWTWLLWCFAALVVVAIIVIITGIAGYIYVKKRQEAAFAEDFDVEFAE
jgi:cytochrome c-type biogenesis protein CcmH/NrfF